MKNFALKCVLALQILWVLSCNNNNNPIPQGTYGYLNVTRVDYFTGDTGRGASAIFLNDLTPGAATINAGSVTINGQLMEQLNDAGNIGYAEDFAFESVNLENGVSWTVSGAGSIAAFTHTIPGPYPGFAIPFPDSIQAAMGWNIPINSTTAPGMDTAYIEITGASGAQLIKTWGPGSTGVSFTQGELATLMTGPESFLVAFVYLARTDTATYGSKAFRFTLDRTVTRYIVLY